MNPQALKQQIIAEIDASQDEALLKDVADKLSQHLHDISDTDLTLLCMSTSEKSLAQAWSKEDNERWNAFLKN